MPRSMPLVEPVTSAVLPVRFMVSPAWRRPRWAAPRFSCCRKAIVDVVMLAEIGEAPRSDDAGSVVHADHEEGRGRGDQGDGEDVLVGFAIDRKSTRLNSSH